MIADGDRDPETFAGIGAAIMTVHSEFGTWVLVNKSAPICG